MKPLVFGFAGDKETWEILDQYLLGDGLMVCPVTEPFYFGTEKREGKPCRRVYLPGGCGWYDYWTKERLEGGRWIMADAPLDRIPLFVREGTILPKAAFALSTKEQGDAVELTVYAGADGCFSLYEDAGDGYGYEKGEYRLTELVWKEKEKKLLVNGGENERFSLRIIGE